MLKLIELRIGSWISYQGNPYRVAEISGDGTIGIVRELPGGGGVETLFVKSEVLGGIKFTKEILKEISGYSPKDHEEDSNCYLISIIEKTKKGLEIDWSLSIRELEGSWWVNIEESSVSFETVGEGEFYYLHDFQNIISSLTYLDITWKPTTVL